MIGGVLNGLNAYQKASGLQGAGGAPTSAGGPSFGDMLSNTIGSAIDDVKKGEGAMVAAAKGQGDLVSTITAISQAETTMEAIIAVRDKVVNAYQDIMRMPI